MVRSTPAALLAALIAVFAFFSAGCSHVATTPSDDDADADFVAANDKPGEPTRVDEADIGVAGPTQIEDAIDALDAKADGESLVTTLGAGGVQAGRSDGDLFARMRTGFLLTDIDRDEIDREESWYVNHPAYLDRTFKRGERYLYHIVNELEARKMPLELALLPVVESAFNPVAYSRARASGLWQFIPATGRRYGLKQNWYYDGRRDVLAATGAALDYLQALAVEFDGDWLLAIAAYNCGEMNVERALEHNRAAGEPTDFFSLKLPKETRAYVPKLMAMRRIVADPASQGLAFASIPNQPYFAKVDVAGQIDLQVAAESAELPEEELLALNPAFNHWVTDPDGPYHLLVPVSYETKLSEAVAALPPEKRVRIVYHRVRPGDTLGGIADKYGVSLAALRTANKIKGTVIHPGDDLLVTSAPRGMDIRMAMADTDAAPKKHAATGKHVIRRANIVEHRARTQRGAGQTGQQRWHHERQHVDCRSGAEYPWHGDVGFYQCRRVCREATTYVVRKGDTLSNIASKFRVSMGDLLGWNRLKPSSIIKPGQRLVMYRNDRRAGI